MEHSQLLPPLFFEPECSLQLSQNLAILSQINPLHASRPTYLISSFILSTHLRLGPQSDLLPLGFPTKTLYTPLFYC